MVAKALPFLDRQLADDYRRLKRQKGVKLDENHLGYTQIQYLYMRSFFNEIPIASGTQQAFDYYYGQAKTYWPEQRSLYERHAGADL